MGEPIIEPSIANGTTPAKWRAHLWIELMRLCSTRMASPLPPERNTQMVFALRRFLDDSLAAGCQLPAVSNQFQARTGDPEQWETLCAIHEIVVDAVTGFCSQRRHNRYKSSNEFSTFLTLSIRAPQESLESEAVARAKQELNLRTRQCGCLLTAMATMLMTPETLRELLTQMIVEDGLDLYVHVRDELAHYPEGYHVYLTALGMSGAGLMQRYLQGHFTPDDQHISDDEMLERIRHIGLYDPSLPEMLENVRAAHSRMGGKVREFEMDEHGRWTQLH
ncbi:hypothetical protein [Magnetofaba australis]|nr:hypothetical protein [Magnetofaba australis]